MKKYLIVLVAMSMIACSRSAEKYRVTYTVHYPSKMVTKTVVIDDEPYLGSDRGTNYLRIGNAVGSSVIETSAPIEINSIVKLKKDK